MRTLNKKEILDRQLWFHRQMGNQGMAGLIRERLEKLEETLIK